MNAIWAALGGGIVLLVRSTSNDQPASAHAVAIYYTLLILSPELFKTEGEWGGGVGGWYTSSWEGDDGEREAEGGGGNENWFANKQVAEMSLESWLAIIGSKPYLRVLAFSLCLGDVTSSGGDRHTRLVQREENSGTCVLLFVHFIESNIGATAEC